jgi:hypothetical protein
MQKTLLAGILAASVVAPTAVYAQPTPAAPAVSDPKTEQVFVVRPAQVLAIGAGVVVGIVVMEALIPTELGYIAGGIVGGYLANVWYGGRQLEIHMGTVPKA